MPKNLDDHRFDDEDAFPSFVPGKSKPQAPRQTTTQQMPQMPPANPLAKYFRVPGVSVKLPTHGAFMPPGSIEFTMNDEVPVYPMRAADELLLKSPDALMNGYAIEKLIESCVPAIRNPRLISSPDLDVILMAIRAATMGEILTINQACPACGAENEFQRHLGGLLEAVTDVPPENIVRLSDDVVVYVRPHNLEDATKLGIASYEETRKVQALEATEADQTARGSQISRSMTRLANLNTDVTANCILKVVVPEGPVMHPQAIREFIGNIPKLWTDKIADMLEEVNRKGIQKNFDVKCVVCQHEWKSDIEFNPSTFFDSASSAS